MKKLALVTAIAAAATISTGTHAQVLSSNITAIDLEVNNGSPLNLAVDCATGTWTPGFTTALSLKGPGLGAYQIRLSGTVCLDTGFGSPYVALVFGLSGSAVASPNPGTVFNDGTVSIFTDFGTGWIYYGAVDASVATGTPIDCTTASGAGLQWATPSGTNTLPGYSPGNAVCSTTLFGYPSELFLTGTNTN
jgi:hypothetical protein